ncbi:type VI secretion system protein [Paraburkholderia sp.]|uniref:type VI secretion system protein n=1 Tax=Paraburkholderia sp. TaxID=1926495 RepID=UPI00239D855D|nr:type VI secretion system protein [Paraburkholderia sp.]MDE1180922.1 type VI secretion system protein [Paraburkholderia sp.]
MLTSSLFLLSLALLIIVVCAVLGVVFYFALHGAQAKPNAERKIVRLRTDSLRSAFRQAVELIEGNIASRAERYNVPWVLVLNEGGQGDDARALPIAQSGVASVLSAEAASPAATQGISWQFFDRGIVVDIQAAYLGSPEEDGDEKPWDEFLSLCRNYRPQRPFDSVVITVPASMLLADHTDSRLELVRHAKLAHRRLWLAQNRFAMRFAVYVVITGCEALPGFAAFARALPEPLRASMLGWSSPFDLSVTYQSEWVATAMSSIERAVSDAGAELFTVDTGDLDARECLLLPTRIAAMRAQLQLYVDELLRPSAYHEPFFFRGIYLTGDSSELAQRSVASAAIADRAAARAFAEPAFDGYDGHDPYEPGAEPTFDAQAGTALVVADERGGEMVEAGQRGAGAARGLHDGGFDTVAGSAVSDLMLKPAFLRDLFDRKIFLEYGLTRPSRSQHLTRPALHRALRWGGIAVIGVWGLGLVVATVQLNHRNAALVGALDELRGDGQERAAAEQGGVPLPADWYRRKALAMIGLNDRLQTRSAWTVFMPGSWGVVDDLNERVRDRFEQEFGAIAVTALEREMLAHVGQLTGVARDPGTGQLIVGEDCTAPATTGADLPATPGLGPEDQPAMRALQRYVGSVDQLDAALQAMQRLQQPSQGNADALRLAVRYAFGVELQGNVAASLPYFYRNARHGGAYAADGTGGINLQTVQQALRCSFDKGAQQVDDALFNANPLLAAEHSVTSHLNALSVADAGSMDFATVSGNLRGIVAAIGTQQDLLASGKGGWMRQSQFVPGPFYDRAFAHAAQSRLLGPDAAGHARERANSGFQALRSQLAMSFGGAGSGIVWNDKGARYDVAPERVALRDGLTKLLNQPFMVAPRGLSLPALPDGSIVVWDRAQLDQALALGDVRKRFMTDGLVSLPEAIQPSVEQAVDVQFARLVTDLVASAATVAPAQGNLDNAAFDAARMRLVKVRAALTDMGAGTQIDDLDTLVSRDALAHLALVDDALSRSELYSVRQAPLSPNGARGSMLAAFGIADAGSLGAYLDQQATRATALGRQASTYLAALDATDASSPLAMRWQSIVRDLDRYQLKNPNSSLFALEQFVQTVATDPGTNGCLGRFPPRPNGLASGDYFSALQARVYDALLARCSQTYVDDLRVQWNGFSSAFNQGVAGHLPFAPATRTTCRRCEYGGLHRTRPGAAPLRAGVARVSAGA